MDTKEEVKARIQKRARQLYEDEKKNCSQAIALSINETFPSDMSEAVLEAMSSSFGGGIGGRGCLCGALGGSLLSLGLLLGASEESKKGVRAASGKMHDSFKEAQRATCCRIISKRHADEGRAYCARLVEDTAGLAVDILLDSRPGLLPG